MSLATIWGEIWTAPLLSARMLAMSSVGEMSLSR